MKTYEGLYIFLDAMSDEAVDTAVKTIRGEIEKVGGKIVESSVLGRRSFARHLKKKEAGSYVQVIFQLESAAVAELRSRIRLHDEVFRAQVTVMKESDLVMLHKRIAAAATAALTAKPAEG